MKFNVRGWEIEDAFSEGGQGWAYRVRRIGVADDQLFVLKRLKNKSRLARFNQEIGALKKLSHPGILKIVATAADDEEPFYVAEYCEKGSLDKFDLSGFSLLERLLLFRGICEAVSAAHNAQIIHRDLKPPNILMRNDNSVAVGDFGLCLDLNDMEERATASSEAVGARHYIAPELEDGRSADPKASSDCYSLGKLLYYIFGGRSFSRERHRDPEYDLTAKNSNPYLHFVYELLDRTITQDATQRFQNAEELTRALTGVIMKVEQNAHVLDMRVEQPCLYCISGRYQGYNSDTGSIRLKCNNCGNLQQFLVQEAQNQWWKKT
ncbi:MAG TPA: serine/threonine-protein kinase [Candidatus Limnocylindrales bacterium]|nr:serine/threonine-protein kinase [Candidatus Limnocylindrales bacterium]